MKQILSTLLCMAGLSCLSSCVRSSSYSELRQEYDSIARRNQVYEMEVYQTDSLVASVLANFQDIQHIESMININPAGQESSRGLQGRIEENMHRISDKLQSSNQAIEELTRRLEASGATNTSLYMTVQLLKLQYDKQFEQLNQTTEKVSTKLKTIEALESNIVRLKRESERIGKVQSEREQMLLNREHSLNQVHYCLGTHGDLREMGLYQNDEVTVDNARLDYLTQVDMREFKILDLQSKKAKVHSIHPKNTYRIEPDERGALTLHITNPQGFWLYSRVLVIEVF